VLDANIENSNGDFVIGGSGLITGPWSSELAVTTPINAIPPRCNVINARRVDGYDVGTF
jgi:hypothetical protein